MARTTAEKPTKSPRLIRRGDVVTVKGTNVEEVVRGVAIVLQLANGVNDTYDVGEMVTLGVDTDLTPAQLLAAAQADAQERAEKAAPPDETMPPEDEVAPGA